MRAAASALLLTLPALGCFAYRGPADVREALRDRYAVDLEREAGFKAGFFTTKLAGGIAALGDDDFSTRGLSGVALAVYSIPSTSGKAKQALGPLEVAGWTRVLRARNEDSEVVVLVRVKSGSIHELMVVTKERDEGEVAVLRLRGRLESFLEKALRDRSELRP